MIGVYFSLKERMIYIHRKTIRELGTPAFFRFLFNPEKRKFAIQVCGYDDPGGYPTPELRGIRGSHRVNHTKLLRQIWRICGWDEGTTYRVKGVIYHSAQVAEFLLDEAEPVNSGNGHAAEDDEAGVTMGSG